MVLITQVSQKTWIIVFGNTKQVQMQIHTLFAGVL